ATGQPKNRTSAVGGRSCGTWPPDTQRPMSPSTQATRATGSANSSAATTRVARRGCPIASTRPRGVLPPCCRPRRQRSAPRRWMGRPRGGAALEGAHSGGLDGGEAWPPRRRAARLGLSPAPQTQPAVPPAPPRAGRCGTAGSLQKNFRPLLREVATAFPEAQVEVWAVDEHRIGLKPLLRRGWAAPRPPAPPPHRRAPR